MDRLVMRPLNDPTLIEEVAVHPDGVGRPGANELLSVLLGRELAAERLVLSHEIKA
jgi:hypothetical protein